MIAIILDSLITSLELDDIIEVHGSDFAILTGTVKSLLDLIFSLSFFVFGKFQVVLTSFVKVQEILQVY